jgi:hypothetical protein
VPVREPERLAGDLGRRLSELPCLWPLIILADHTGNTAHREAKNSELLKMFTI